MIFPERVRLKVTLKAGDDIYLKGEIFDAPLPAFIQAELREKTGTVEAVEVKTPTAPPAPPAPTETKESPVSNETPKEGSPSTLVSRRK